MKWQMKRLHDQHDTIRDLGLLTVSGFWQRSMVFALSNLSLLHQVSHYRTHQHRIVWVKVMLEYVPKANLYRGRTNFGALAIKLGDMKYPLLTIGTSNCILFGRSV
jgi:hypothetical protein